jgi:predicted nucleic acid-binding protein
VTVVCNATPLINFAVINRLDVLQATFGQIIIPQAVYDETSGSGFPGSQLVLQAIASGWLQVRLVSTIAIAIPPELDDGEREAITLALETGEQQILLDEREARQIARSLGLQVIGTLGILLLAKNQQIIPQVQPLLDAMIDTAQYWVSATLYQQVLQQAGEVVE